MVFIFRQQLLRKV